MTHDAGHACCAEYGIMKARIQKLERIVALFGRLGECDDLPGFVKSEDVKEAKELTAAKPVRTLTQEEYEAKVAAGKKIKFAEGGEH